MTTGDVFDYYSFTGNSLFDFPTDRQYTLESLRMQCTESSGSDSLANEEWVENRHILHDFEVASPKVPDARAVTV
jgi:hypothetical protein